MSARTLLSVVSVAALAAGAGYFAVEARFAGIAMAAVAAAVAGLGVLSIRRGKALSGELALLREHLDTTRQQAAVLARHTRELRETIIHSPAFQPDQPRDAARANDFAAISTIVRDVADGLAEIDRRTEALEGEIGLLQRKQGEAARSAGASPGWVAPAKPAAPPPRDLPAREMAEAASRAELRAIPTPPDIHRAPEAPRAVRQLVAAAIASDRFDLFLQRIVGLPQRKIRGYDVTLRPDSSDLAIPNDEIRLAVDTLGHQLPFDRRLIIQTVRLARMFERRERDVLLFVDISQRYLMSEAAHDELAALVEEAPTVPQRIVLCLPQRFFRKAIAFEHEALRKLTDLGFRFLMREVEDFELELPRLYQMGVRWVRAEARGFVDAVTLNPVMMGVSSADFVTVLNRRKISFIADQAGDDETVAELIDLNVEFAHGNIFAPPQAVRADALEDAAQAPSSVPMRVATPAPAPSSGIPAQERRGLRELVRRA